VDRTSRIFVAGADTLIGAAIVRQLQLRGYTGLVGLGSSAPDLRNPASVDEFFRTAKPEFVFVASGRSAGIQENQTRPASLMIDNLQSQTNVIDAAHRHKVTKLLYLGSSCSYPRNAPQPMAVESLLTGSLEPTNEPYAIAKLAGMKLCQAYAREFGDQFIVGIPANIFGIDDEFTEHGGHVIPALIVRLHAARTTGAASVDIWGTGEARREFMFADDLADACLFVMDKYTDTSRPINLGCGAEGTSIREAAEALRNTVGFAGQLRFDATKPDGMPLKCLDSSPLFQLGWRPRTPFAAALSQTYDAYLRRYHKTTIMASTPAPRIARTESLNETLYRSLYRIRRVEEEIARVYPTDKLKSPVHLSIGQEAVSVGVCEALNHEDVVFGTYRGHAMYLAKGGSLKGMVAEMYGKATGCTKGKGGSMHLVDTAAGVMGTSAVVGTTIANAVGYAYAMKYARKNVITVCFFGDGATEEGVFAESLNFACLKKLPMIFVCENNGYAIHTSQARRQGLPDITGRARANGVYSECIGDNDVFAIHDRTSKAVNAMRAGVSEGPFFFECKTYRWKEHVGPNEDFQLGYRTPAECSRWVESDQVKRVASMIPAEARTAIESAVEAEVKAAFDFAEASPFPAASELFTDTYAPNDPVNVPASIAFRKAA
jgi:TPP-dependent pyruvate/acetoin dehydrogenase alpha subunit/nucleoside-diphosphate-sugar epimerase